MNHTVIVVFKYICRYLLTWLLCLTLISKPVLSVVCCLNVAKIFLPAWLLECVIFRFPLTFLVVIVGFGVQKSRYYWARSLLLSGQWCCGHHPLEQGIVLANFHPVSMLMKTGKIVCFLTFICITMNKIFGCWCCGHHCRERVHWK